MVDLDAVALGGVIMKDRCCRDNMDMCNLC